MCTEGVSRPPGAWLVTPTTNPDTPIPDINKAVIDPGEEVLNPSQTIIDDEEPKFYRQAISGSNADLWHSAIAAEMDVLQHNHTWDVIDRPNVRKVVDSKWVFKIRTLFDGPIDKFKAQLVANRLSQIHGHDYDKTFVLGISVDSLHLVMPIVITNGSVPPYLDIKGAYLYGELRETIYLGRPEGYRDGIKVAHLTRCIYGLKQLSKE
jgi:hypothetical protein